MKVKLLNKTFYVFLTLRKIFLLLENNRSLDDETNFP
jgi:hypothetical protein